MDTRTGMLALAFAGAVALPALSLQRQVFRGGVDLISVDATVLDDSGTPVRDISADQITITVDGTPRRIVSVQYVDRGVATPTPAGEGVSESATSAPSTTLPRSAPALVCLAFDHSNIRAGEGRIAVQGAATLFNGLRSEDLIALVSIPPPGPFVDFTTDRARVREATGRLAGSLRTNQGFYNIGLVEARAVAKGSVDALKVLRARECYGERPGGPCDQTVELEARRMWQDAENRALRSLNALSSLVGKLAQVEDPKTIVLLTEGLAADSFTGELRRLALDASRSRVTLYVLHLDSPLFEAASSMRRPISAVEDADYLTEGVRTLADATRGAYLRVIGSPEGAMRRILRELGGYYLIGVEPDEHDRDGKPHRLNVRVARSGVTVRSRREFVLPGR